MPPDVCADQHGGGVADRLENGKGRAPVCSIIAAYILGCPSEDGLSQMKAAQLKTVIIRNWRVHVLVRFSVAALDLITTWLEAKFFARSKKE